MISDNSLACRLRSSQRQRRNDWVTGRSEYPYSLTPIHVWLPFEVPGVCIHLLCYSQAFPGDLLEPTYSAPNNQENLLARSEVDRRQVYTDQLETTLPNGGHHPLVQLVKCCLKNTASQRPTAEDVLRSLEEIKATTDGPCGEVARADAVRQVVMMRAILGRETEVRRKTDEGVASIGGNVVKQK